MESSVFSKIMFVPGAEINGSPAMCNRVTRTLKLNADIWHQLSKNEQDFIIYHEEGHIVLQSRSEDSADQYAFDKMVKEGRSLRDCVLTQTKLLSNSLGHRRRAYNTLQRAKVNDILNNKLTTKMYTEDNTPSTMAAHFEDSFLGFGKNAKAKRAEKRAFRKEKRQIKLDRKRARVANIHSKAQSRITLAEQGVAMPTGIGSAISSVASMLGGGGGGDQQDTSAVNTGAYEAANAAGTVAQYNAGVAEERADKDTPKEPKKNKSGMIVIIVLVVIIIMAIVFALLRRKK